MGWPIYVLAWVEIKKGLPNLGYGYVEVYGGRSWIKAILAARKAKREGAGCVKLEWR